MIRKIVPILLIAAVVAMFYFSKVPDYMREQFGVERWACAEMVPGKGALKRVAWVPRATGVTVVVNGRDDISYDIELCRTPHNAPTCRHDWQYVVTAVDSPKTRRTISLTRSSENSDGSWHFAIPVSGETASQLIRSFATGSAIDLRIEDQWHEPILRQQMSLLGFNEAMKACAF